MRLMQLIRPGSQTLVADERSAANRDRKVANRRVSSRAILVAVVTAIAALAAGLAPAGAAARTVNFQFGFDNTAGLQLNGSAKPYTLPADGYPMLQLTPAEGGKTGSAFDTEEIPTEGSFWTEFVTNIHGGTNPPADGMAFVLQPLASTELGGGGGGLGYATIKPSLEVQIDLFQNTVNNDPSAPYISVMENGEEAKHLATSEAPLKFPVYGEGNPLRVLIEYAGGVLKVYAGPDDENPTTLLISYPVNLAQVLGSARAYAGFTAATGADYTAQELFAWTLHASSPALTAPEFGRCTAANFGNGYFTDPGCSVEDASGKSGWEWTPDAAEPQVKMNTATGDTLLLESVHGWKVRCANATGMGAYSSPKTVTEVGLTLNGCEYETKRGVKYACGQEVGAGPVHLSTLEGVLGVTKQGALSSEDELGLDLYPTGHGSTIARFECQSGKRTVTVQVRGAVIAWLESDHMLPYFSLTFDESRGHQALQRFVGGASQALEAAAGTSSAPFAPAALGTVLQMTESPGCAEIEANNAF